MASNTNLNLRDAVLYSVFVRDHTPEGTFRALEGDLARLKEAGVNMVDRSEKVDARFAGLTFVLTGALA